MATSIEGCRQLHHRLYVSALPRSPDQLSVFDAVLSVLSPPRASYDSVFHSYGGAHLFIECDDIPTSLLLLHFDSCVAFLRAHHGHHGKTVLVHCMHGVSRSVCVALAYLMTECGLTGSSAEQVLTHSLNVDVDVMPPRYFTVQVDAFVFARLSDWGALFRSMCSNYQRPDVRKLKDTYDMFVAQQMKREVVTKKTGVSVVLCSKCRFQLSSSAHMDGEINKFTLMCTVPSWWMIESVLRWQHGEDGRKREKERDKDKHGSEYRLKCPSCNSRVGMYTRSDKNDLKSDDDGGGGSSSFQLVKSSVYVTDANSTSSSSPSPSPCSSASSAVIQSLIRHPR